MDRQGLEAASQVGAQFLAIVLIALLVVGAAPMAAFVSWYDFGRSPIAERMDEASFFGALAYALSGAIILGRSFFNGRQRQALLVFAVLSLAAAALLALKLTFFG